MKVEHGWVTLTGAVGYHYNREAARDLASRITGVKSVSNLIEIKKAPSLYDVRRQIMNALERSADVDASTISVSADGDMVKLTGKLQSRYERSIAERAAWATSGINRIADDLMVI